MIFALTIWWWQLGCIGGCTPDSVIKLGWEVNGRWIQDKVLLKICAGSLMTWRSPYCFVMLSTVSPSKEDFSRQHQLFDLTLKSRITTAKKGLFWTRSSQFLSKFSKKFSNSSWVWIGNLYKEIKLKSLSPFLNSKLMRSCK